MVTATAMTGYAPVNGLSMYYEIHGAPTASAVASPPLLILYGSMGTLEMFGPLLPALAETRQVIAPEMQAHGRTADINRPLSYEQMADDTAALLDELGIGRVDVFGFSMGAAIAMQLTIRHPHRVRKLVHSCATSSTEFMHPEVMALRDVQFSVETFRGSPIEAAYLAVAPDPDGFPKFVDRVRALTESARDWPEEQIRSITAPTLTIAGDADIVRPEGAVAMFRLLGGGVPGDFVPMPAAQLAILPGTTHLTLPTRTGWLHSLITAFLDAPTPEAR